MFAITLLTLAATAQGVAPSVSLRAAQRAAETPRDSTPYARTLEESGGLNHRVTAFEELPAPLGGGIQVRALSSGSFEPFQNAAGASIPALPIVYEVSVQVGAANELFLFQRPADSGPRPMLVVFHKFGVGHFDALAHTSFFQEARRRGWYCLAPLGGGQRHFANDRMHEHTETALDWAVENFAVDGSRVYGAGFSMGGGAALNYAARHLDPTGVMFAAVFNQSGIVSHEDTYLYVDGVVEGLFDSFFGNGGPAQPWPMQRASLFSFDPLTSVVDSQTDLARNLLSLATFTTRTTGDVPYLMTQNDLLHAQLLARGADPMRHKLAVINYPGHSWDAVSERAVCDWLRSFTLQIPSQGDLLADTDGRFHHFDVAQDAPGQFTPFSFAIDVQSNTLAISASANLASLGVHLTSASLNTSTNLTVDLSTADGFADEVRLLGWPSVPSQVLRDGIPTALWSFDALNARLTLLENHGGAHAWTVVP